MLNSKRSFDGKLHKASRTVHLELPLADNTLSTKMLRHEARYLSMPFIDFCAFALVKVSQLLTSECVSPPVGILCNTSTRLKMLA